MFLHQSLYLHLLLSDKSFTYQFRKAVQLSVARAQGTIPEGGLMLLAVGRMCKSRFAEHASAHSCTHSCAAKRLAVGFA